MLLQGYNAYAGRLPTFAFFLLVGVVLLPVLYILVVFCRPIAAPLHPFTVFCRPVAGPLYSFTVFCRAVAGQSSASTFLCVCVFLPADRPGHRKTHRRILITKRHD